MTPAHIGGLPVEESVAALAPVAAAMTYFVAGALAWLRRRLASLVSVRIIPFNKSIFR